MTLRRSTTFTIHALDRVAERLTLPRVELAEILDRNRAVTLGVDEYSNRLRRLFFSPVDDEFFVAVQDAKTGDVVTVLPLEYYANLHGLVPEKRIVEAAAFMGRPPPDVRMMRGVMPRPDPGSNPGTSVIRVCAVLERADGSPLRKNLGSWPAEEAPAELELLARDPRFLREVRNRLAEKGFTPEPPLLLDLRQGKHGDAVLFSVGAWPDPDASGACDFAGSRPQVIARASQHG